jgi:hypothetical protein
MSSAASTRAATNGAENAHLPTLRRGKIMERFKSARHLQRFFSIREPIANLKNFPRQAMSSSDRRALRSKAMVVWREVAEPGITAQRQGKAPGLRATADRQVDSARTWEVNQCADDVLHVFLVSATNSCRPPRLGLVNCVEGSLGAPN